MSTDPVIIRVRDLRRERSLTQEALAEALGLSRQSINALEAGRCLPSLPVALQIARFFSVPLHRVFIVPGFEEEELDAASISINPEKEHQMSTLTPWSPLREMREMLDDMMDDAVSWSPVATNNLPALNLSQTAKEILVELRLPGYTREDVNIEVGEDFLTISGEAKEETSHAETQHLRREFMRQSFTRTISLPSPVQVDQAEAEMKHGILHVRLPKRAEEKPKTAKLEIRAD